MKRATSVQCPFVQGSRSRAAVQELYAQAKPPALVIAEIDVTIVEPMTGSTVQPAGKRLHLRG